MGLCIEEMYKIFLLIYTKIQQRSYIKKSEATQQHLHTRQRVKIMSTRLCALKNNKNLTSTRNREYAYPETPSRRNKSAHLI
jgi:hypothetical protein